MSQSVLTFLVVVCSKHNLKSVYMQEVNGVKKLVVEYPNIIKDDFWQEHPHIIKNTDSMFTTLEYIFFFTLPLTLSLLTRLSC